MSSRAFQYGVAALTAAVACIACSLTTDLGGLSGSAEPADGGGPPFVDGGAQRGGGAADALADAADAADPSAAYGAVVLTDGPVAYYRFDEPGDANSAKDSVGMHVANATGQGVTFASPGVRGRGATFDGTSALDVGDVFDFAGKQPFTIEFWVRSTNGTVSGELIHKRDQSDPAAFKGYILYCDADGTPHFEAWGVSLNAYSPDVLGTTFTHVVNVVSYELGKGNAKLFVNGKPSATGGYDNTTDLADTPAHLRFGVGFKGVLDEIALYDKALPQDRILEHYRAGR